MNTCECKIFDLMINAGILCPHDTSGWTSSMKLFAVNVYQETHDYIRKNYKNIMDISLIKDLRDYLIIAVSSAKSPETIKLLSKLFEIDINTIERNIRVLDGDRMMTGHGYVNYDCLTFACRYNSNLSVIDHVIKNSNDLRAINYLQIACRYNNNCDVIKYLVNHYDCIIDHISADSFKAACCLFNEKANNIDVVLYLIEAFKKVSLTDNSDGTDISFETLKKIIPFVQNNERLNNLLMDVISLTDYYDTQNEVALEQLGYNHDETRRFIKSLKINPLLLKEEINDFLDVDPMSIPFSQFMTMVDQITTDIPFVTNYCKNIVSPRGIKFCVQDDYFPDYASMEPLFIHNKITYLGIRKRIYKSMLIFEDIVDIVDIIGGISSDNNLIELEGDQPKYLINMYIHASYTGIDRKVFNIKRIDPCDIIGFIRFIDQYPSNVLSIDLIEKDLIEYFNDKNIEYSQYMKDISIKYKLRYLYVDIHNKNK